MSLTRLQVETLLVGPDLLSGRLGRRMAFVNLYDPTSATLGAISALADPIAEGLRSLGIAPVDPTNPQTSDLAAVTDTQLAQLLDVAEYRAMLSVIGNLDEVDEQEGSDRKDFTKFAEHVLRVTRELGDRVAALYGYGAARLRRGRVGSLTTGASWPPSPPPPMSSPPYPTRPDPRAGRRRFNP